MTSHSRIIVLLFNLFRMADNSNYAIKITSALQFHHVRIQIFHTREYIFPVLFLLGKHENEFLRGTMPLQIYPREQIWTGKR